MGKKSKLAVIPIVLAGLVAIAWLFRGTAVAVLDPKGSVAEDQFNLIVLVTLLSLIVVVPVFVLTFYIVWKYRVDEQGRPRHKKAKYMPEQEGSKILEGIWWGVPIALITILSVIIWKTSHSLDPFRQIRADKQPLTVQVIAMEWKWLFIYPEQNIASINYLQFPEDQELELQITSDAPMNSLWIPQLGSQIYAMAGMSTSLHLLAEEQGVYKGQSANISGRGFSGMKFDAKATSKEGFEAWVASVKKSAHKLTAGEYTALSKQTQNHPVTLYASAEPNLYETIIGKYTNPEATSREANRRETAGAKEEGH